MMRYLTGPTARSAAFACALAAVVAAPHAVAQQPVGEVVGTAPADRPAPPPPAAPQGLSESVAAVVNDDIVSTYDLAQRMRLLIATSGVQPTQENLQQFQREALVSLVDEHLQFQELRRVEKEQKIDILADDAEINEEIAEMAKGNNMSAEQFMAFLASRGIGQDTLKQQLRAQVSWSRWIQGRYGSRLRVGDDQIAATQALLAAQAAKPQYNIGEVLIDANRVGGMQQAMTGAQQLVTQMQQGAPFPAVARQFSALPTAANGGDAGWVSPSEVPPEVGAVLEQMRPGQLSQPIQVKDGVYILYLREKRAGGNATLVNLKQVAIGLPQTATAEDEAAARAKLVAIKPKIQNCAGMEAAVGGAPGVIAGDLGEAEVADLAPAFREAAEKLKVNEVSDPIRTPVGLHLISVCSRRTAGDAQADKEQIERRLRGQQLSMIARRYMRDLRNSATIETK
ncbi:MAG: peptidylprolyl isomerase [Alphaproteobacteria bacterium]|nr:peptidylprolyl isomerase [Alphaproteobacteria bacterium]MBU1513600.1 peptidylprolyl isomerase [Alphaproteobacteria bacterium]MBU2094755.1 peptidylprolyl isomerase [Alphaproteobacteria bacterium]MBU2150176.1 peptidylprolyl isomerase [Alphaproteobacteria bacterium]MBU2309295.1 peptidylprolyl isomerase [Alphaproteobacteria bacterium]